MNTLITVLIILSSILLILVVFVQNPKGGGLSSDFGAATQLGGVQKTNDFIDKATWSLAGIIAVLSIILTIRSKSFEPTPVQTQTQTEQAEGQAQQPATGTEQAPAQ
jgi:preprotein translocase subunit SecG